MGVDTVILSGLHGLWSAFEYSFKVFGSTPAHFVEQSSMDSGRSTIQLMKSQIARVFIALAIGIIAWQVAGNITRTSKYYILGHGRKMEVPRSLYESNAGYTYPEEKTFNDAYGIPCGSIAFALALIVFFGPVLLHRDKIKEEG